MNEINEKIPLHKRPIFWEIVRFLIVGGIATIADFLVSALFLYVIYTDSTSFPFLWFSLTRSVTVSTLAGFTVGVIVNYILSIVVVFKNVENKKRSQSVSGFIIFLILGFIGMVINLLLKEAGNLIISFEGHVFWFMVVFAFATIVVLIYNYITRKLILFRAPKENKDTLKEGIDENGQQDK